MAGRLLHAALSIALACMVLDHTAWGQNFPARPVTMIVPFPAGGATDIVMRALATATEKHLGQSIVVENRGGAGGTLGPAQMAAHAKPDGYTVAQLPITLFRYPFMTRTTFDPARDFTYIIGLTGYTFGVVVRSDSPWHSFRQLLDDARAHPGKINYGTPGAGTSLHITMEQIARLEGIRWTHVPFKGNAESNSALLGGHIDVVADSTGWAELVNSGKFRLLVTWGAARTRNWPDVPTLKEIGIDLVSNSPFGIGGPAGLEPAVVATLHDAFKAGMAEPDYTATMTRLDMEPFYLDSASYRDFAMQQIEEQRQLVRDLGLKVN